MSGFTPLRAPVIDALTIRSDAVDGRAHLAALLAGQAVAVVGSRASTAYGDHIALELGRSIAEAGITVAATGGYGIGVAALRGALSAGGRTIAVLPCHADETYPSRHCDVHARVAATGVVMSHIGDNRSVSRTSVIESNLLLAGITGALIVVESSVRSVALQLAHDRHGAGRPVFAVPGPVTSALSVGCHNLIKAGVAQLLTEAADLAGLDLAGAMPVVTG